MAIARKPTAERKAVDVEALINKGGSVPGTPEKAERATSPVVLRVPTELLEQIDRAREGRKVKIPRHTWLLEALVEKLEREGV